MTGGDPSSLEKGLAILRELAVADGGLAAGQLAQATGLNRTTIYRLCETLERGSWVRRGVTDETTRFELGVAAHGLAVLITNKYDTEARLQPVINELCRAVGETVHVGVLSGAEVIHVARALPAAGVSVAAPIGAREFAHCASLGKAILATLDDHALAELYPQERLAARTENSLATRTALRADLCRTRQRGYALDEEEGTIGIKCVAVPVFGAGGQAIFALSVTGVRDRMVDPALPRVVSALSGAAALLTAAYAGTIPTDWGADPAPEPPSSDLVEREGTARPVRGSRHAAARVGVPPGRATPR